MRRGRELRWSPETRHTIDHKQASSFLVREFLKDNEIEG
jgi:hypothetical protein